MPHKNLTTDYGAQHFAAKKELFEIQRGNNFEFIIPKSGLDNLQFYGENGETQKVADANEIIRLSIAGTFLPHFSQNPIEVRRGNTAVKYAGVISWDAGEFQCYDFIGARTKDILMGWQAMSGNPRYQTVGQQVDYKMDCNILEYPPDYSTIVRTWKVEGCWISAIREDSMSADANSSRKISCTIQYDRAFPVYD